MEFIIEDNGPAIFREEAKRG